MRIYVVKLNKNFCKYSMIHLLFKHLTKLTEEYEIKGALSALLVAFYCNYMVQLRK